VRVFKPAGIIFCALIFLAGCAITPPPPVSDRTAALDWSSTNGIPLSFKMPTVSETNRSTLTKINLPPLFTNSAPIIKTNIPAAQSLTAPLSTWISLNRWANEHKIGKPHRISNSPLTTYAIGSSNGVMLVSVGNRAAAWNGIEVNLGFEPQFIDGEIFLHGLDLQKNLEPLLCEPPFAPGTNRVIVIDPGHGGKNTGTSSVLDGRFEKEFTLDWAKRLAPLLETNGWTVFLTHTNDSDMSNAVRVVFAEEHHADLFISLHFNSAAPDQKAAGLEIYCLTPAGMPSTLTRGWPDIWSQVFPDNAFDAQNLQLAFRLQKALLYQTGLEDRGICRARFMTVLQNQNRPAILIEAGFLSNPADAKLIESEAFRQKLAETVADALK
jgi:N-acetylmuramoyl-L-alanine amidase